MDNQVTINNLGPGCIFNHFARISEIDRASGREGALADYIISLALDRDYTCMQDASKNVVVFVPASPGKEDKPPICLQSHSDMVATDSNGQDFDTSQIEFVIKGGKLKANRTTLGADNGIGIAAMLSLMTEPDINHGPLILLFTSSEETGLIGANAFDSASIAPKYLLNLDSEEWKKVTVGCAGGGRIQGVFVRETGETLDDQPVMVYEFIISGLHGGHSGMDISGGYANAIILMARLLSDVIEKWPTSRLVSFNGGSKMNAIPSHAKVELATSGVDKEEMENFIALKKQQLSYELGPIEPDFNLEIVLRSDFPRYDPTRLYFSGKFQGQLLQMLQILPNGVIKMDPNNPALLMSSSNIGVIETKGGMGEYIVVNTMYRSSSDTHKEYLKKLIASTFQYFSATEIEYGSEYPAWVPEYSSYLLDLIRSTFNNIFPEDAEDMTITTVHGGLECAVFANFWPGIEIISFGPDIRFPHSIDEEVDIASVKDFWLLLQKILEDFNPLVQVQ